MTLGKRLLLFGGAPRSGTTALYNLLSAHPSVCVGNERYLHVFQRSEATPTMFDKAEFLDVRSQHTHAGVLQQFDNRAEAAEAYDGATVIGDKIAPIWRIYPYVWSLFPDVELLYILRNPVSVAESYQCRMLDPNDHWSFDYETAVREWNDSVALTLDEIERGRRITVVSYEELFASRQAIRVLFDALDLDFELADARRISAILNRAASVHPKPVPEHEKIRRHVARHADFDSYRQLTGNHCLLRDTETGRIAAHAKLNEIGRADLRANGN